jgi:hypothetical protein
MGHSGSKEAMPQEYPNHSNQIVAQPPQTHFPLAFNMYYEKSWTQLNLQFGEHDTQPLYSAALPEGWWGKLVMHGGPNAKESPTLATVKDGGNWKAHSEIILSDHLSGGLPIREVMRVHGGLMHEAYIFSIPIGHYGNTRTEKFEWRRADKHELQCLGESSRGWKLVRLGENYDEDTKKDKVEREIVAVWAETKIFKSGWTKAARFQFLNSGATGELGDVCALMAVVTFTRVWQRKMQIAVGAAVAS